MKAVVQRVSHAKLVCDGVTISEIDKGLVVFFGVKTGDDANLVDTLAKKIPALRIFEDQNGKMNLSVKDIAGEILVVSQFTLFADVLHGNRPSFSLAEKPERAKAIYEDFIKKLQSNGVAVKSGVFGGDMKITQINDGPVTIIYDL